MAIGYQSASVSVVHSSWSFRRRGSPLDTLIVSYLGRFVKGFLVHFFSSLSQPLLSTEAVREFFPLPLTMIVYHSQK